MPSPVEETEGTANAGRFRTAGLADRRPSPMRRFLLRQFL